MNKSILIVDNEPGVLNGLRRILHNICHVDTALSATIALEKIKQNKTPYAVIITDLMMPGIDGLEFLKQLETIDTHSIKIMLTSSDSQQSTINAINQGKVYKFLRKPCQPETLFDVINTSIIEFQKKSDVENQGNLKDEIKKLTTHLNFHYHHDSLTGLLNRSTFITQLSQTLQQQEEQQSWLCYIDMDFFHLINEAVGNVGGDELLRQISQLLSQLTPDNNLIARLNGNAFALLLKEMASEQSQALVNKIHATLNQHVFIWNYKEIQVSASLGVIPIESNDNSVHAVLNRAENACKVAKQAGRHRVHFGDYQDKLLSEKFNDAYWVNHFNDSIENNHFCLFQQSIVPINQHSHQGKHYEVLLRHVDKNQKLTQPGEFLHAAERYQISPKIDKWVISNYARWLANHPKHLAQLDMASLNLSGLSINDIQMMEFIDQTFSHYKIPKHKICLEITETAAIDGFAGAVEFITKLKQNGFRFALDDFGTGWSSYAYLKWLPIDILKIDGSFIKNLHRDKTDRALAQSICDIGHTMGLKIVAEFVENKEILYILTEMGVDFAQGYHLAKPQNLSNMPL